MLWSIPITIAVVGLAVAARNALARHRWKLLQTATDAGAVDVARRELRTLKRTYRRHARTLNILELTEAWLLVEEERYADARKLLEIMNPDVLDAARLAFYEAELALCMAHTGQPEPAAEIAHVAAWRAEANNPKLRAHCLGVAGVAYLRAGKLSEAAATLQGALREGGAHPYGQAMRAFHLGEALLALGRTDEAQQAYDRSRLAAPGSRWSLRAEERLQSLAAQSPYR
jgi:tetratricopeptide (TPR) repeat protein